MKKIIDILQKVCVDEPNDFYKSVKRVINEHHKMLIVTANPEIIMMGKNNDRMHDLLMNKSCIIPDGIGVVKAEKILGKRNAQRNPGISLVEYLLEQGSKENYKVFLYGSKAKVLDDFKEVCNTKYPGIEFVGLYDGYTHSDEEMKQTAIKAKADVYLAALGTPHQELFLSELIENIASGVCIGIGGSIDVLSGNIKRAPSFFIDHNLEWLYRITTQPKRLKRFYQGNICFVFTLIKELLEERLKK